MGPVRYLPLLLGLAALPLAQAAGQSLVPKLTSTVHPVPLTEKTDAATCVECHSDMTKGKFVHSAMSSGCLTCHQVRVTGNVTRVKLLTGTPLALCVTCHTDKEASQIKGKVHEPAVHGCLMCHDPHSSNYKYELLEATSGATKKDNLCLTCHTIGEDVPKGGSRHAALDMGCETCHSIHKSGDPAKREFAYHLRKDAPALCVECHDASDPALLKAHDNQPFAQADCLECHDPHQSSAPMLAEKFTHPPYATMGCDTCHAPAKDGKVVLATGDVNSLCTTCHDAKGKEIQTAKVQHLGAMGDCTVCHSPHAGTSPAFLKPNPVAVCLACHAGLAEQGKKAYPHQPVFEQACAICHQPHGSENANLLRVSNINSLCLECHGPGAKPQPVAGTGLVAIFNGKVELPANYFRKVPRLPLTDGRGHPVANHPISGTVHIKSAKAAVEMNCLSCHQPHASSHPDLLVNDDQPNMAFCDRCHTQGTRPVPSKGRLP